MNKFWINNFFDLLFLTTRTQSFQYRRDFDTLKDFIEHYWSLTVKRQYGTILDHMGPYETLQGHTGPNGTIRNHKGPKWTIGPPTGPYRTLLDHTGP